MVKNDDSVKISSEKSRRGKRHLMNDDSVNFVKAISSSCPKNFQTVSKALVNFAD